MDSQTKQQLVVYISERANESELLELCLQIQDREAEEARNQSRLKAFLATSGVAKTPATEPTTDVPTESVKRIRKDTVDKVIGHLTATGPDVLNSIAQMLGSSTGKVSAILQVMHEREQINFDGKHYSVK